MNSSFEYQESLNSLHFTEEEKAAIARRAAEAARKQTRPARRPVRRIALIAAAAVLVLAVGTAGATGILRPARTEAKSAATESMLFFILPS